MKHREPAGPAGPSAGPPGGSLALLASELATIYLGLWAASRLYGLAEFTAVFQAEAVAVWIVTAAATRGSSSAWKALGRIVGLGAVAVLAHNQRSPALGLAPALALGIMLAAGLSVIGRLLRWAAGGSPMTWADGFRGAGLQLVAAYALQAYVANAHVGSGDAYHYSLMLSDSLDQAHFGVFPLFVGQSPYAFNGNIHTLRTAPLFEYAGAGLDLITLHTLPIFGLQNLILLLSGGLGAVGAYAALRRYAPGRPWEAAALAALYVLSPGVLVPLYEGDLIATFLTVPIMPWILLGLADATDKPEAWAPWFAQAASLAALWWAHPPIAFWVSLLVLCAWLLILVRGGWAWRNLLRMAAAGLVFSLLAGYVFVSVASLHLRVPHVTASEQIAGVVRNVAVGWRSSFRPITGRSLEGDYQLGYSLMGGLLAGLLALHSRRSAAMLLAGSAALLLLLWPIPGVTARLWSWAPAAVLTVTNGWPMQRFYVILAGLAAFAAMAGISRTRGVGAVLLGAGVAIGLGWSGWEAHKLIVNGRAATSTPESSENSHRIENVALTISSYQVFNFIPSYFSHGVMAPILETRLRDLATFDVIADGATPVSAGTAAPISVVNLARREGASEVGPSIRLAPGRTTLLRFDFLGRQPEGQLSLSGPVLARDYGLPSSGMSRSFGAGPENGRTIAIGNDGAAPEDVMLHFFPALAGAAKEAPFARVTVEWLESAPRVVRLHSLIPFEADVQAEHPALLETPKLFIPGYRATVNGSEERIEQTGEGLVGVVVPAGRSVVRLWYPGGLLLRVAFWASAIGWIAFVAALPFAARSAGPGAGWARRGAFLEESLVQWLHRWGALALVTAAVAMAGPWVWLRFVSPPRGALRMVLSVPWATPGSAEPLVTTGRTGAGDIIYLKYLGKGRFAVGHDKWAYGGEISQPFAADPR
ncbi:MAG TPA: hypothetical protein VN829_03360, partial [Dongiaceae bacterium]|nr:hypothetical protein [Dongiaceae bacterium]